MTCEFIYKFMYMKNIVKSYLNSCAPRFQMGQFKFIKLSSAKWSMHINAIYVIGQRFSTALLPRLFGKNSHTTRAPLMIAGVRTGDQRLRVQFYAIAIYRLGHILHINLHISAYFFCIFFAYSTNTVYIIASFLHIFYIFLA